LGFLHRKADFNCNEVLEKAGNKAKWEAGEKESSCGEESSFWRSRITEVYRESSFWRGRITEVFREYSFRRSRITEV